MIYGLEHKAEAIRERTLKQWCAYQITDFLTKKDQTWCSEMNSSIVLRGHRYLTLKHRETHGCVVSTVATDALVLKHQAISIHNADLTFIVLDQFHIKISHLWWTTLRNKITFLKKWPSRLGVKLTKKCFPVTRHVSPSHDSSENTISYIRF